MVASLDKTISTLKRAVQLTMTFDVSAPWLNRVLERKPKVFLHAVDGVLLVEDFIIAQFN